MPDESADPLSRIRFAGKEVVEEDLVGGLLGDELGLAGGLGRVKPVVNLRAERPRASVSGARRIWGGGVGVGRVARTCEGPFHSMSASSSSMRP